MDIQDYLGQKRGGISARISAAISEVFSYTNTIYHDEHWLSRAMDEYAVSGKMLRGSLVFLGYDAFHDGSPSSENAEALLDIAAALELLQAGLLVHDDIMDKDTIRRGKPTMHVLLREKADKERTRTSLSAPLFSPENGHQTGEALAICVGDIYYFIAIEIIAKLTSIRSNVFAQELIKVCLAQMQDVRMGNRDALPTLDEILNMYRYKTARYTISLPLASGASLAGASPEARGHLESLGENLGILFQLQDDYLGLFGNSAQLGKPIGSDIREGKKTPFIVLLFPLLNSSEKEKFLGIFGHPEVGVPEIAYIRDLLIRYGVLEKITRLEMDYGEKARRDLAKIGFPSHTPSFENSQLFEALIDYSLTRKF